MAWPETFPGLCGGSSRSEVGGRIGTQGQTGRTQVSVSTLGLLVRTGRRCRSERCWLGEGGLLRKIGESPAGIGGGAGETGEDVGALGAWWECRSLDPPGQKPAAGRTRNHAPAWWRSFPPVPGRSQWTRRPSAFLAGGSLPSFCLSTPYPPDPTPTPAPCLVSSLLPDVWKSWPGYFYFLLL